jgi:hypothetical protein
MTGSVDAERVRVVVVRSGGLTGRTAPPIALDTAGLPAGEAQRVRDLVDGAHVDDLPAVSRTPRGRDMVRYDVTVTRGDRTRRVGCDDGSVPASLRALIDHVLARGRA